MSDVVARAERWLVLDQPDNRFVESYSIIRELVAELETTRAELERLRAEVAGG